MSLEIFSKRLKELRSESSENPIYQTKLSEDLNISLSSISQYENGVRYPDTETLIKIADYFHVTTDYLLGNSQYRDSEKEEEIKIMLNQFNEKLEKLNFYEQIDLIRLSDNIAKSLLNFNEEDQFRLNYISELVIVVMKIQAFIKFSEINFDEGNTTKILETFDDLVLMNYKDKDSAVEFIKDIYMRLNEKLKDKWQKFSKTNKLDNNSRITKGLNYHFKTHLGK